MNAAVVHASALLGMIGPQRPAIEEALLGSDLAAPELVDLELAQALRRSVRLGILDDAAGGAWLSRLTSIPGLTRVPHRSLLDRVWQLRENITAYDASYVALAEMLRAPLVTLDRRLARAAEPFCDVVVPG